MRLLIVGCGYVGLPLGAHWVQQGHEVVGIVQCPESEFRLRESGITPWVVDITDRAALGKVAPDFDWVVHLVSSGKGELEMFRKTFLEGTRNVIDWLQTNPPKKFIYTSSTRVYSQRDGSQVKESTAATPMNEGAGVLIETEQMLLRAFAEQKFPALILRVAGIYGPTRGHLFLQYLRNEARIAGHGERHINMIHLEDLVGIILTAFKHGHPGEIYNAVDDEPVAQINFFRWLSETLGKHMPPFVHDEGLLVRKRGFSDKKVSNRKVKMEMGYQFRYPTFRQGYTAEIQRLEQAGKLDLELESRENIEA